MTVAGADPAGHRDPLLGGLSRSNLGLRVLSSLVLIPLALGTAYAGGLVFLLFWSLAALIVLWEWDTLICAHDKNPVLILGVVAIAGAAVLLAFDSPGTAVTLIVLAVFGVATLASRVRRFWCAAGLVYAGLLMLAPVLIRSNGPWGFAALMFLFVIVWSTDIAAYFVGRAVGGAKLMPRVSPSKTWSGAVGGTAAGILAGVLAAHCAGARNLAAIALVAFLLSAASQAGDLFESSVKRRFNAKDSSALLPGHGGLMDRIDGFIAAAVLALLIGLVRSGMGEPARGLMVW